MADDEIQIIDDPVDPLANVGEEAPKDVKTVEVSTDPDEVIRTLKAQLETAEAARAEEARLRAAAEGRAHSATSEVQDSQLALVTNALETVKQNGEVLKANLQAAWEAGDFATAAGIQEQISENVANRQRLQEGKQQLEQQAKAPKPAPRAADNDPVETMARNLTPASAAWLRAHPDYAKNPRLTQRMLAAHNLAVTDNVATDTPEYFAHVEQTLGITARAAAAAQDEPDGTAGAAKVVGRRDAPPPSAPSPSNGSTNGSRQGTVRLNASEREMAQMMGMTDQEYAKNKLALQKEGKIH